MALPSLARMTARRQHAADLLKRALIGTDTGKITKPKYNIFARPYDKDSKVRMHRSTDAKYKKWEEDAKMIAANNDRRIHLEIIEVKSALDTLVLHPFDSQQMGLQQVRAVVHNNYDCSFGRFITRADIDAVATEEEWTDVDESDRSDEEVDVEESDEWENRAWTETDSEMTATEDSSDEADVDSDA
ncbi:hypothetical protein LTR56_010257 [Elasticomyces elasticus]|nr:hypothetical protein LTR56_010257 [Elasticomyces elasticus]KAK3658307.1 hypothetical protein LTR22_009008 [Elasticomyces elasticus]KAK4922933.1 hypothetical protein LTR49_009764 [Elasticomyces elasticus]KAK5745215.1 hypothetical protein LTS12_023221 [Elasticomyces elasticus]